MPLFLASILLVGYFLLTQRVIWKRRTFLLFCILAITAITPFSEPLLKFGFEWLAFVNGDMSYYSTSSTRLLDYGYSELPISGNIYDLKDHSLMTWDFHNNMSYRTGADLFLAYLVGLTRLTAHQVYMPLIIAINFCVVAGAGALTLLSTRKLSFALWTMVLVALSPMLTIEVTMQQLAQAIGLALLTGLCVSYAKMMAGSQEWSWKLFIVLAFSSLAISYFEIIPFFVLYILLFEATRWKKWSNSTVRIVYLRTLLFMICGILLLLNSYIFSTVERILVAAQLATGHNAMNLSTFPFFAIPSNGATLWGWIPLSGGGPVDSLVVVLGLLATILFAGLLFTPRIRHLPSAQMSIVMLVATISLWNSGSGYGLFKIAMFIQPFLLATFVAIVALFVTKFLFQQLSFAFLGLSFVPAQQVNIYNVTDDLTARVAYASTAQLGRQLREIRNKIESLKNIKVFSDTASFELFSLQAYYFKGFTFDSLASPLQLLQSLGSPNKFVFSTKPDGAVAEFRSKSFTGNADEYLLTATREFGVINRGSAPQGYLLQIKQLSELTNHLIGIDTSISAANRSYYSNSEVSIYQLQRDTMFPGQAMSAIGQYHLFRVLGSVGDSRMQLSLSSSGNKQEDFRLPAIRVIGGIEMTLPLVGRGSARLVSTPINPRKIDSADYMGIDFGQQGVHIDEERTGVMALFGKSLKIDDRKVAVYSRDISYISPEQYIAIKRPQSIQGFPVALEDEGLEYSGIFEDGWISDAAYVVLQVPQNRPKVDLHLSGVIPGIGGTPFSTLLTLKVNDRIVYKDKHTQGEVNVTVSLDPALFKDNPIAKIQIESSVLQRLPNGDDRPVSMHLSFIGFK